MNQERKWITTGNLIGGLFTFLLCTTGLALAGVFMAKLAANHSQVALTDFLLLALGLTILVIGYKCNFEKFIFTSGGLQRINILFCRLGLILSGFIIAITKHSTTLQNSSRCFSEKHFTQTVLKNKTIC